MTMYVRMCRLASELHTQNIIPLTNANPCQESQSRVDRNHIYVRIRHLVQFVAEKC